MGRRSQVRCQHSHASALLLGHEAYRPTAAPPQRIEVQFRGFSVNLLFDVLTWYQCNSDDIANVQRQPQPQPQQQ